MNKGRLAAFFIRSVGRLPLGLARAIGRLTGFLLWLLPTDARRTTDANLALCYPQQTETWRRQVALASLQETGITACEIACIWALPITRILALIERVEGREHVDLALQSGKGVVLIAPHLGNWEVTNYYVAQHYPLVAMYAPPKLAALETLIHGARERSGGKLVPANKRGVIAIFRHLRAAGVTGILPDQEPAPNSGVFAPFFGHQTLTPVLVSKLLQETGAKAVVIYALRQTNGQFRLVFRPAEAAIYHADLKISAGAMNQSIEQAIQEAPDQYQWEYKRFRKRPPGEPRRYAARPKRRKLLQSSSLDS